MNKQKADIFIAEHVTQYGLVGSNTNHNDPKYPQLRGGSSYGFSKDFHFVWGYNGKRLQNRRSSTCMYSTFYRKLPSTGSVLSLDRSLVDIAEQLIKYFLGRTLVVVNRGRPEDHAFVEACKQLNNIRGPLDPEIEQIVLSYDGDVSYDFDDLVKFTIIDITPTLLLNTAELVVPWLRTSSIDVIQDIVVARAFGDNNTQLVYPSRMNFVNHNHDGIRVVGPANWALRDAEEDTALMRYDWFNDSGNMMCTTTNLAVWSPELMASQLSNTYMQHCLMGNTKANANYATDKMWESVSPISHSLAEVPEWWEDVEHQIVRMHDGGKHNEQWYTPLPRLLDTVGIPHTFKTTGEAYGTVY